MNPSLFKRLLFKNLAALLASIIGFVLVLAYTRYGGIGLSPDSISYLSAARNLKAGLGLTDFTGYPLTNWPAGYPIFLGLMMGMTHMDIMPIIPFINAGLFACVIFITGLLINQSKSLSPLNKNLIIFLVAIHPCLLEIYTMMWSETIFIPLSLGFILSLRKYLKYHRNGALIEMGVISALAFLTRFAAISWVGVGLFMLLVDQKKSFKKRITNSLIFSIMAFSLITINLIRNLIETSMLSGIRQVSRTSFIENFTYSGITFSNWTGFFPQDYAKSGILVISILCILFLINIKRYIYKNERLQNLETITNIFFLFYAGFIIISSTISRYEEINSRLLSASFIPMLMMLSYFPWQSQRQPFRKLLPIIGGCLILYSAYNLGKIDWSNYQDYNEGGVEGYTEDSWKLSPTIHYIHDHTELLKGLHPVYSNANHAVYLYTGFSTAALPERVHKEEMEDLWKNESFYVIWFGIDPNPDLVSMPEIAQKKNVVLVKQLSDGAVYFCRPKHR